MEEGLAELTVAPSCVVLTCVTHASTHIARCQIQGHVKVTTAGMPMALTFWDRTKKVVMEWADPQPGRPGRVGYGTYPGRHGGAQALLRATGGPGTGPDSAHSGYQLCDGGRHKGHAPGREEGKTSLSQSPSLPSPPAAGCPFCGAHHAFHVGWGPGCRPALRGMAMAQAAASGHKLIEGIVVEGVSFEAPLGPVTQCVQFGEVHTEISHT